MNNPVLFSKQFKIKFLALFQVNKKVNNQFLNFLGLSQLTCDDDKSQKRSVILSFLNKNKIYIKQIWCETRRERARIYLFR